MNDLTARLSHLSAELAELEEELRHLASAKNIEPAKICDETTLTEVKNAVDRIRHLLWPYVQASVQRSSIDDELQRYRMQRVTQMLHDLRDRVAEPEVAAMPEAKSFFSSIQEIATTAVERHLKRSVGSAKIRPTAELTIADLKRLIN